MALTQRSFKIWVMKFKKTIITALLTGLIFVWFFSGYRTPSNFVRHGDWLVNCDFGAKVRYHNWFELIEMNYIPLYPDGVLDISIKSYLKKDSDYFKINTIILAPSMYSLEMYNPRAPSMTNPSRSLVEKDFLPILNGLLKRPNIRSATGIWNGSNFITSWNDYLTVSPNGLPETIEYIRECSQNRWGAELG